MARRRRRNDQLKLKEIIAKPPKGVIKLIDPNEPYEADELKYTVQLLEKTILEQEAEIEDLELKLRKRSDMIKRLEARQLELHRIIDGKEQEKIDAMRFLQSNPDFLEIV